MKTHGGSWLQQFNSNHMHALKMSSNPFDCFDYDDDDFKDGVSANTTNTCREKNCGVLTFHKHTEQALLTYVQNYYNSSATAHVSSEFETVGNDYELTTQESIGKNNDEGHGKAYYSSYQILSAVDNFCTQRHWMMHIGPQKSKLLTQILRKEIEMFQEQICVDNHALKETSSIIEFNCMELGTYCAYSSILLGR